MGAVTVSSSMYNPGKNSIICVTSSAGPLSLLSGLGREWALRVIQSMTASRRLASGPHIMPFFMKNTFLFKACFRVPGRRGRGSTVLLTQALLASTVKPDGILSTQLTDQLVSSATPTLTFIYC